MPIHSRWITVGVATGLLALIGASLLHAQQQPQHPRDTLQTGAVMQADTALKAAPGTRTGRTAAHSGKAKWKKRRAGADSIRAGQDSTHQ
jgi:hypothetical protein